MLPERFVNMRERHTRMNGVGEQYDDGGVSSCHWCDELWPCSFVQVFDALDVAMKALHDATEGLREMRPYVPDYFAQKWMHDGYIERAEAAIAAIEEQK